MISLMMMMRIPLTIVLCFSFFSSLIGAIPLEKRDIWNPPILSPDATTVWTVGDKVEVTWNITEKPPDSQLTSPFGRVVLGFLTADSLNLMFETPLAQGFRLSDAKVTVTVPNVPVRDNYIIVVFGDSGNHSPTFTITGGGAVSGSASGAPSTSAPASVSTSAAQTTQVTAPIPITGSVITGGSASPTPSSSEEATPPSPDLSSDSAPAPTSTEPSSSAPPPSSAVLLPSSSSDATGTALPASETNNNASLRLGVSLCLSATMIPMVIWALF